MYFNVQGLAKIIIITIIGLSYSTLVHAEKKKIAGAKTSKYGKSKWVEEPSSFLSIQFGKPLSSKVSSECPRTEPILKFNETAGIMETVGGRDLDIAAIDAMPDGSYCFKERGSMNIMPIRVLPFSDNAKVSTDDGSIEGNVEQIEINFVTSSFDAVSRILIEKYGKPHTKSVAQVKTKGGAEFDNQILNWAGNNISIHVESFANRQIYSGLIYDSGIVSISTRNYIEREGKASNKALQDSASKL